MTLIALFDLTLRPEALADAPRVLHETLQATRAFPSMPPSPGRWASPGPRPGLRFRRYNWRSPVGTVSLTEAVSGPARHGSSIRLANIALLSCPCFSMRLLRLLPSYRFDT